MKRFIVISLAMTFGAIHQSLACAPLAQGTSVDELTSNLKSLEQKIYDQKQGLKDYTGHRFNWHTIETNVGAEGSCSAIAISSRINIQMDDDDQFCVYSAMVNYSNFPAEQLTLSEENLSCF